MWSTLTDRFSLTRSLENLVVHRRIICLTAVNDSPTNTIARKTKPNGIDDYQHIKAYQNMKSLNSPKHIMMDYSDLERSNIYAETPPKVKSTTPIKDSTSARQRPPIPVRTDSSRSVGNTSMSSQTTTPSNSFRQDPRTIMSRSTDSSSSSSGLTSQIKNVTNNNTKSKSTYDIETAILYNNNKCLNMITSAYSKPLQSVKEDECLEVNNNNNHHENYSKNDNEQQRILMDILRSKSPSSTVSTPMMPRNNTSHQRSSSTNPTEDEVPVGNINGFIRNNQIRSSLPFIIKPAINTSKTNSLGLCFLICGNETKKVLLPAYISCLDTLKALFVRAFPQYLTMKQMDTENIRIYIRETEKDIFYQLDDVNDVKDRSILKIVQLNNNLKQHVSFKEPEINDFSNSTIDNEDITYQRLSRVGRTSMITNGSDEEKLIDNSQRSHSEPRREVTSSTHTQPSTTLKGILSSPRSGSVTPRIEDNDARTKIVLMEKQLESLTDLVKQLTTPTKSRVLKNFHNKSFEQQLHELKVKTHTLRNDLISIRRMQQSIQENFKNELDKANQKIQEQFVQNEKYRYIENDFNFYIQNRTKIDQDLEDLEISVEELQNDVKSKQCYVTINDVEGFAFILSTISRSLVDLKATFPILQQKLSSFDQSTIIKFLREEPERLDYTIKKCKRLTTMLYQLKRVTINQENKPIRKIAFHINEKLADRKRLLEEIHLVTLNSEERVKAIEKAEKLRKRRLYYEIQLENLKQAKSTPEQVDGYFETRSLTNSLSTRTSICSTDSNNCPSPSLSYIIRQALIAPTITNDCKPRLSSTSKSPSKVTFCQQLTTNEKSLSINKKPKPNPPPRIQSTPSSSAVSSASSSSSSCTGGNSRFCGIIPLISVERRQNGRCYSFSSSSTDTDSVISNSHNPRFTQTTLMRTSVTDL
ncbi:unnamed protein product [Adineta steineri]|uniref:Actin interacting protein 3 C-terminal domain-containing protein n=2 Tax=Adineta steineri TaxID=433720 RepID=A0A818PKT3_9BILA|nr:unnamed protein product [Adineta steineri]CAF3626975.1 unnamed protein product [Adineta steineri]